MAFKKYEKDSDTKAEMAKDKRRGISDAKEDKPKGKTPTPAPKKK